MTVQFKKPDRRLPLGELLVAEAVIDRAELQAALDYKEERGVKLGQALVALHMVTSSELALALRRQGHFACIELTPGIVDPAVARSLGAETSRCMQAIAINRIAGVVTVAMEDPAESYDVDAISLKLGALVFAVHADSERIQRCLDLIFPTDAELDLEGLTARDPLAAAAASEKAAVSEEAAAPPADDAAGSDEPGKGQSENLAHDAEDVLRRAIVAGWSRGAKDLHVEGRGANALLRLRIDGALETQASVPARLHVPILDHLRGWTGAPKSQEPSEPERVRVSLGDATLELLVTIAPGIGARDARVRITAIGRPVWTLEALGFSDVALGGLRAALDRVSGLVLVSAGADQGLTTTLSAIADHLGKRDAKSVFVAPSREYALPGVTVLDTLGRADGDLAAGIRVAIGLAADVIVVDRLEGPECARAVHEALATGALVVAGLLGASPEHALERAQDLGLPAHPGHGSLAGALHQMLVPRLCAGCRRPIASCEPAWPAPEDARGDAPFFAATGCVDCRERGYRGRVAMAEVRTAADGGLGPAPGNAPDGAIGSDLLRRALAGEIHGDEVARRLGPRFEART